MNSAHIKIDYFNALLGLLECKGIGGKKKAS